MDFEDLKIVQHQYSMKNLIVDEQGIAKSLSVYEPQSHITNAILIMNKNDSRFITDKIEWMRMTQWRKSSNANLIHVTRNKSLENNNLKFRCVYSFENNETHFNRTTEFEQHLFDSKLLIKTVQ